MKPYTSVRGRVSRRVDPATLHGVAGRCERLEARTLMDAVFWDGGAGTTSWHDAANWNRNGVDAVPQNGDDVTINVAANPNVLFLSGSVSLASLVTNEAISINAGTLAVTGNADVNATLTVNGGMLQGGTWDVTGGVLTTGTNANSTLSGLTVNGDLSLGTGARARIQNGITFSDAANRIRFTGTGGQQLGFVGGGSLLSGGISFEGTSGISDIGVVGSGTLTIGPEAVVSGGRGRIGQSLFVSGNSGVALHGSVLSNVPGAVITLTTSGTGVFTLAAGGSVSATGAGAGVTIDTSSTAWSSAGSISAAAGAVLNFADAWSSSGTISINASTLSLGGSFSYASLAAGFSRVGGTVNITGVMNNQGQTVVLDAGTGDWVLSGGTISGGATGGSIRLDGASLIYAANNNNTLDRQTFVAGDLVLMNNAALRIVNGVQFASPATQRIRLGGSGGNNLGFMGNSVIPVNMLFQSTSGTDDVGAIGAGILTIAPGVAVSGGRGRLGQSQFVAGNSGLVNNGTIAADVPGLSIIVSTGGTGVFTNSASGTLRASEAGATLTVDVNSAAWSSAGAIIAENGGIVNLLDSWSNSGTISVNAGTLNLGGSFNYSSVAVGFSRIGGVVNITGAMNNQGQTVSLSAATGDWVLSGGSIIGGALGGSIAQDGASLLFSSSTNNALDRQSIVSGDLVLGTGQALRIVNGISFAAPGTQRIRLGGAGNNRLGFVGDFTLPVNVAFEATAGTSEIGTVGNGTLTIPAGVTVSGGRGVIGSFQFTSGNTNLINQGSVLADVAGASLVLDASGTGAVISSGSLMAVGGATLTANRLAGDLAGASVADAGSSVNLNGSFALCGVLAPVAGTTISINPAAPAAAWSVGAGGGFDVQGGTLNLGGSFGIPSIANFSRSGGSVNLVGILNNEAQIFALNAATGSWNLNGGTIAGGALGGTMRFLDGVTLTFSSNAANTLDRQTVENDIALGSGASLRIVNGITFADPALRLRLSGAGGNHLGFMGDTLLATGGIVFENTSGISDAGAVGNAVLTIGPGVVVTGGRARLGLTQFGAGNGSIVNNGLIVADEAGQTLTIQASGTGTFMNAGQLAAVSGATLAVNDLIGSFNNAMSAGAGSVLNLIGSINVTGVLAATNAGTISINPGNQTTPWALDSIGMLQVQSGTLNMGGSFTLAGDATYQRAGGNVNITGVLHNEGGDIVLSAATGSWNLGGGTIDGGGAGGTLRFTEGATLSFNTSSANTLSNQSIDGDLVVGTGGKLRISGGLNFLNSANRLRLGGDGGNIVAFSGDVTLSIGGIVFEAASGLSDVGIVGSGTLTIGPEFVVSGGRGRFGLSQFTPGTTSVVNNGLIEANLAGQNLTIDTSGLPGGAFTNNAIVRATGGGRFTVSADTPISNLADGVLSGGTWIASGASVITLTNAVIAANNATVGVGGVDSFPALATMHTNNGSLMTVGGGVFTMTPATGTFINNGVITLAPGNTLGVAGNFAQASPGSLEVQFQGPGAADIGQLTVSGNAALGGSLFCTPVNNFQPASMSSLFLSAGTLSGQFASQALYTPAGGYQSSIETSGGEIRLVISLPAVSLRGDYNLDGVLNRHDFTDFMRDFTRRDADYNQDGRTNSRDLIAFMRDFHEGGRQNRHCQIGSPMQPRSPRGGGCRG